MREIKFRAWFILDKKMVEHENLSMQYDRDEGFTFAFDYMSYFDEENMKGTLNFELMQYTGLKDKNGKEIYEGDIFQVPEDEYENEYKGEIRWYGGYFGLDEYYPDGTKCGSLFLFSYNEDGEVIGNIYENPELLEETP